MSDPVLDPAPKPVLDDDVAVLSPTAPPGRPVVHATGTLSDAVAADRQERRDLLLMTLELSRTTARRRRRPVSRYA